MKPITRGVWETKKTLSCRPIFTQNPTYKECLQYLVRVIEQDSPHFPLVLNLASFATSNELSDKQKIKADEIISYYQRKGVL